MIQKFIEKGYELVDKENVADICIVNTCTVTNMSDRKSRQILRGVKEKNPTAIVVAVGCYAQVSTKDLENIPEIDLVLGNNEKADIVNYVENYIINNVAKNDVTDVMHKKDFVDLGIITYTEKTRAVIKVQDGCDRFCSYCIIPYARGRVRSRKPESILEEIRNIANNNIKEVVITGIHVASYGKDFKNKYMLIDLLEDINKIDGIERIRLGSLEPMLINKEFINRLSKLEKICHHFHLSLQSGCDETLKRMNRRYTTNEFRKVVNILKNTYKDVILTTDIIVGFPEETDEEFEETYKFLSEIKFYKMHIFKYSPRKGTKATLMKNQIYGKIKEERSKRLLKLSDENQIEYNKNYIGKKVKVLFEEKDNEGYYKGHTDNYILVKVKSIENLDNKISEVLVEEANYTYITGKM